MADQPTIQPTLWSILTNGSDWPRMVQPRHRPTDTIQERFRAFHAANPHVYENLRIMALELKRGGHKMWGMKALFEVLRFTAAIQTEGDVFRLNNNYTALYARLLMENEPELRGFFELRERKTH